MIFNGLTHAEESDKTTDLKDFLCKDLMRFSGADRDIAIAVYHGYMLGKKDTTKYVSEELALITDKVVEYCLDNPKVKTLDAFTKFIQ
jgi:hypothetical protein